MAKSVSQILREAAQALEEASNQGSVAQRTTAAQDGIPQATTERTVPPDRTIPRPRLQSAASSNSGPRGKFSIA